MLSFLPDFWQIVSMVNSFCYGFLGIFDISVTTGLTILIISPVVLFRANLNLTRDRYPELIKEHP